MLLHGDRQDQRLQLDLLIDIYQEFSDFDKNQLPLIEPLRAMRMVNHLAWIIERWLDPDSPLAFPWLTNSDYWYQKLSVFHQQIETMKFAESYAFHTHVI